MWFVSIALFVLFWAAVSSFYDILKGKGSLNNLGWLFVGTLSTSLFLYVCIFPLLKNKGKKGKSYDVHV